MSSLRSIEILLVDDNANMRTIVGAMLRSFGVKKVREAGDGAEALSALRQTPADIAIIDFRMLPLDGATFTRMVRTAPDSPNPYLPIIMMTGHSDRRRVFEARDAGVTELIAKPVTAQVLLDRIQSIILKPRPYIRTDDYFGPDRRRTVRPEYAGPYRRSTDPKDR